MPAPEAPGATGVLVIDDEPRLRQMLVRCVRELGYPAAAAGSAEQALGVLAREKVAIAIVDLNMPGMDGLALMERLRERWPAIALIVLSGYGDLPAAQEAIRLEVADFLTKPCRIGELEIALERARRRVAGERVPEAGQAAMPGALAEEAAPWETGEAGAGPEPLSAVERRHILQTLERFGGDREATAEALGISRREDV